VEIKRRRAGNSTEIGICAAEALFDATVLWALIDDALAN